MKIYTRSGDDGTTGLYGGRRVSKASLRVEAYGLVDEVNATLGWSLVAGLPAPVAETLGHAQAACFRLGAWLAAVEGADPGVEAIGDEDVAALEAAIDVLEAGLEPLRHFVLPGGGEGGARLHVARTVARRAERAVTALHETEAVDGRGRHWLNRLSDYLFVAARTANAADGVEETKWVPRPRGGGEP